MPVQITPALSEAEMDNLAFFLAKCYQRRLLVTIEKYAKRYLLLDGPKSQAVTMHPIKASPHMS